MGCISWRPGKGGGHGGLGRGSSIKGVMKGLATDRRSRDWHNAPGRTIDWEQQVDSDRQASVRSAVHVQAILFQVGTLCNTRLRRMATLQRQRIRVDVLLYSAAVSVLAETGRWLLAQWLFSEEPLMGRPLSVACRLMWSCVRDAGGGLCSASWVNPRRQTLEFLVAGRKNGPRTLLLQQSIG
eukprot:s2316_g18.t1